MELLLDNKSLVYIQNKHCGIEQKNGRVKGERSLGKNTNTRLKNAFDCLENDIDGHFIHMLEKLLEGVNMII